MSPKHAVVLGSRFGGLAVLAWLRRLYSPGELSITVIDQWQEMIFRPGLVHAMDQSPHTLLARVRIPLVTFWKQHQIAPLHDTIVGLDPERQRVYTASHPPIPYDVLFIATGSTAGWTRIPGLNLSHQGICEGYLARHTAIVNARHFEGRFVLAVGPILSNPHWTPTIHVGCECPLLESALLWDQYLRKIKRRDSAQITVVTPAAKIAEDGGPVIQARLEELFHQRQIHLVTNARFRRVTEQAVELQNGSIPYDQAVWIPPATGSTWLRGSGVDDGWGWVPYALN